MSKKINKDLLPCPFCGGEKFNTSHTNEVWCKTCGGGMYSSDHGKDTRKITTESWNTRADKKESHEHGWVTIDKEGLPRYSTESVHYVCLDAQGKLHLERRVGHWWHQYVKWFELTSVKLDEED